MGSDAWGEIQDLFFRGLDASSTARKELLSNVRDPHVVAAVTQLWADAAEAPSRFLREPPPSEPERAYKVGEVVAGRFRLDRLLGTGGMGEVFAAIDERLDRAVALKFLNRRLAHHPVWGGLLEREARAICRLADHPNVCTVHDLYWDAEPPFLVMELLDGETLADRLRRGPLPIADAVAIGLSIVDGLAHAHARDVIHRDLKPANVMLTPFGPKLFDFGIAKRVGPAVLHETSILAPPGTFVGSPSYTSPEQAEGLAIDARSDIFSVGCLLYEMATGVKAFDGPSLISTLSAVLRAEPRPMADVNPAVPSDYANVVARCLEKDPSRRFQRAVDLRNALDRLARSGFDPVDRPAGGRALRPAREQPAPAQSAARETDDSVNRVRESVGAGARGLLASGSRHPICVMLSLVWGVLVGLALLVEIAYEWGSFAGWALPLATLTCLASTGIASAAFAVLRRRTWNERPRALLIAVSMFVGWSLLLAAAIAPQLPNRSIVRAKIQTMTANVGYPKSLLEALALPILALVPLHVVCALEAELKRGRAERVYRVLSFDQQAVPIRGALIVRPNAASIVFGTVTIWWMSQNARLLESLEVAPYYSLFLKLGTIRVSSGLLMLFAVLAWYVWTLNELRQQAHEAISA